MPEAQHAAILRWLAVVAPAHITVACAEAPLPGSVVLNRCLTEVPFAWLAELATHCPVRVAVDHCAHPEAARGRIAEMAALTSHITLDGGPGEGQPVRYAAPPARRRGLLALGSPPPGPSGTLAQRLATALAVLPLNERAESPAARLSVSAACTACGVCVRSCPHDALALTINDGVATLSHALEACQGEEICVALCPATAIERGGTVPWSEVHHQPTTVLAQLPVRQCSNCRSSFARSATTPDTLCPVCRINSADPFAVHLPPAARALLDRRRRAAGN